MKTPSTTAAWCFGEPPDCHLVELCASLARRPRQPLPSQPMRGEHHDSSRHRPKDGSHSCALLGVVIGTKHATALAQSPPPSVTTQQQTTTWLTVNGGAAKLTADMHTTLLDCLRGKRQAVLGLAHVR